MERSGGTPEIRIKGDQGAGNKEMLLIRRKSKILATVGSNSVGLGFCPTLFLKSIMPGMQKGGAVSRLVLRFVLRSFLTTEALAKVVSEGERSKGNGGYSGGKFEFRTYRF